jgi:acetoin utilization deacetylase AcuC-like enzyme
MKFFYDERHRLHTPKKEIDNGYWIENPDKPQRIDYIKERLENSLGVEFSKPKKFSSSHVYLAHDVEYVKWLKEKSQKTAPGHEYFPEVFGYDRVFDTGTPITHNAYEIGLTSVSTALTATEEVLKGRERITYALCRPPGHHASQSFGGGYCYFNNAAIAAKFYQKHTRSNVAIIDIDVHHGNGTQDIFYRDPTVLFVSIHGTPEIFYPWISGFEWEIGEDEGKGYNFNFPLPGKTKGVTYMKTLEKAYEEIDDYSPSALFVSLGLDIHKDDPYNIFSLTDDDLYEIGKFFSNLNLPMILIQEGGYNPQSNATAAEAFMKAIT